MSRLPKFSMPYNNSKKMLEQLLPLLKSRNGKKVRELYFSGPSHFFGSGRTMPETNLKKISSVIKFCHDNQISANLVLNTICGGARWYEPPALNRCLRYLKKMYFRLNIDSVTIADPIYLQKIRAELPDLQIVVSANADVTTLERAAFYKKLGANVITPNGINRNLPLLQQIKEETELELRLMVNEGCIYECPYRSAHVNYISHISKENAGKQDIFPDQCALLKRIDPALLLKSDWIRPEDIKKYTGITDYFKVVGRVKETGWITKIISAYLSERYDGNFLDLLESSGRLTALYGAELDNRSLDRFFEKVTSCNRTCTTCRYCTDLAKKVVVFKKDNYGH